MSRSAGVAIAIARAFQRLGSRRLAVAGPSLLGQKPVTCRNAVAAERSQAAADMAMIDPRSAAAPITCDHVADSVLAVGASVPILFDQAPSNALVPTFLATTRPNAMLIGRKRSFSITG